MNKFAKLQITGTIRVKTGLHIGGSGAFSAIGAVDSPVVRDSLTKRPIIPGSSLKGKMRTLLARSRSESVVLEPANNDAPEILRLFGSSAAIGSGRIQNSRLKFSDCFLSNETELKKRAESVTEVKFENTIDRRTAVANPRQIERVIRGAEFALEIIYDLDELDEVDDDFRTLREGLTLIELDYLGGHGTRGSGRIEFESLSVKCVYGTVENSLTEECNAILGGK